MRAHGEKQLLLCFDDFVAAAVFLNGALKTECLRFQDKRDRHETVLDRVTNKITFFSGIIWRGFIKLKQVAAESGEQLEFLILIELFPFGLMEFWKKSSKMM
ncbi:hypothetical protein TNCV_3438861 [Trichonephila clavipes]|nr:hypothetical protein TNCV_3438861 [Trichonephila clavipes]